MVVDLETMAVSRVIPRNDEITFTCYSQSFIERGGCIVSLVRDNNENIKLIRYNQTKDKITIVCNFGR